MADLQPLAGLTALQILDLSGCGQVADLQPLAGLTALQNLELRGCGQMADLQPLAGLTTLQTLDLSGCGQMADLQPLAGLTALQNLNLSGCGQAADLQPLAGLTTLQTLNLSGCDQVADLQPLAGMSLKELNLFEGCSLDCSPAAQPLATLRALTNLSANRLIAAPPELGSRQFSDNALLRIRGWQSDLAGGEAANSTVKVFVLGNGYVGKTQICRRLLNKDFDPATESTHGISLDRVQLVPARENQPAVDANLWDFGGQDIYLGTHALFLDKRAIYVIAWTPQYENSEETEEHRVPLRNRPLIYWVEYVRSLAGPQAPVIVVQTQCDRELDVRPAPLPAQHGFERLRAISSSAKQNDGMEQLQVELKNAARYLLERYGKVRLPLSWAAVGEEIKVRIGHKVMPRTEFEQICRAKHSVAIPSVVLEYLHRSGRIFFREGVFGNQVVLDLNWALAGVYAVLDRKTALPEIRRQAGHFSPRLLAALVWSNHGEQEHKLFLSLMEQCQICFKIAEDVFIAPALLPTQQAMKGSIEQSWRDATPSAVAHLHYPFLHEGVLRAMLCGIGRKAGVHAVYWAYGVCFYDSEHQSTVRIRSDLPSPENIHTNGRVTVEVAGLRALPLARHLVDSIEQLNIGRAPEVIWETAQADGAVHSEAQTPSTTKRPAFDEIRPTQIPRSPEEPQPVYVSYAWGGDSEAMVDEFEKRLPPSLHLIRDKRFLHPGDWISRFMREIGRSDLVLVVLSEKYLASPYCMRELLHLFHHSQEDREVFLRRVVLLTIGGIQFSDPIDRIRHVKYWKQEHEKLRAALSDLDHASVGDADRAHLLLMEDFQHRVSDILAWVADVLMPQGMDLQSNGIDAVLGLLLQRSRQMITN